MKPEDFGITDYEWVDGKLNVNGNVEIKNLKLKKLPFNFGKVAGGFWCQNNRLTSLEGAPTFVGSGFDCSKNKLVTLEGAPEKVDSSFNCSFNRLTSLEGAPKEVGISFHCRNNKLNSLEGAPVKVGRNFNCRNNPLTPLELIKTLFVDGELPEKYHDLAEKIEPTWRSLIHLESQENPESDDDLLKALEKVSK